MVGWNRQSDEFQLGQWMKGRIYPAKCDLSPSGEYLIYFALNGKWESETKGAYTALSRAPYLKAIGLWPCGTTYGGGGLFTEDNRYWVSGGGWNEPLRTPRLPNAATKFPDYGLGLKAIPNGFDIRLLRDGWTLESERDDKNRTVTFYEKPLNYNWALQKFYSGNRLHPELGAYAREWHRLVNRKSDKTIDCFYWEWADLDDKRLVWAERGCLYAGQIEKQGLTDVKMLHDFNPMQFEAIAAPY